MIRRRTAAFVIAASVLLVLVCVGWAVLVQHLVPTACSYHPPAVRAQYLHCP